LVETCNVRGPVDTLVELDLDILEMRAIEIALKGPVSSRHTLVLVKAKFLNFGLILVGKV